MLGLFMAISVGPTLFAVLKYSLNHSYKAGIAFVLGVSVSDILYVVVANFAASWLEVLHGYSRQIAYGGAVILLTVGLAGLLTKYKPVRPTATKITITGGHYFKIWSSGFLINTINPAVIIIWLGAVTATANTSNWYRFVMFGVCLALVLSIDFCKVFLADAIRRKLTLRRIMYLQKTSSAIILLFGLALFISTFFNIQFENAHL
ncbi:MAG: LysE family transporter [Chitinophagaceae bacterium]|nr:LysE family transporter [Chitinophagaceae bacterium]